MAGAILHGTTLCVSSLMFSDCLLSYCRVLRKTEMVQVYLPANYLVSRGHVDVLGRPAVRVKL